MKKLTYRNKGKITVPVTIKTIDGTSTQVVYVSPKGTFDMLECQSTGNVVAKVQNHLLELVGSVEFSKDTTSTLLEVEKKAVQPVKAVMPIPARQKKYVSREVRFTTKEK